ncbi:MULTISPECIES: hypothetical protein [Bartonella]|uniref:Uncharacterized protein n=1 Tax=Bartonella rochalimae ATCC BAA-1498 TaxID=685782 RepID=E6YN99_9HYPH|nr:MULTISPECIES: hypothetical protein [Bartonella]AQX18870.1 hypothetical protein BA1379B_010680 [Bartonella sp. A1379B]AQX22093.1 hypothetical protein Bho11B_000610 [Bartonella sp. 11B]AQX24627.1 hypothetical protein Bho114_013180 [Bartonella sp. 114]AQX25861.1 hypothetical protein Bco22_012160 [Bartonella sp. Coyote22sub2]KEC54807.1 hypothetical protein O99_00906 [Bartonella rochalimae ATCC BAA-1498]
MKTYLKTFSYGLPLYYAGYAHNIIKLEPQQKNACSFISHYEAEAVARKLALQYQRDDFYIAQK